MGYGYTSKKVHRARDTRSTAIEQIPLGAEVPIHAHMCLYRCGIAWYCYSQFGDCNGLGPEEAFEFPELESFGIGGNEVLRSEIGTHIGRSTERFLLKTVDLLGRISHWKVVDSFSHQPFCL